MILVATGTTGDSFSDVWLVVSAYLLLVMATLTFSSFGGGLLVGRVALAAVFLRSCWIMGGDHRQLALGLLMT